MMGQFVETGEASIIDGELVPHTVWMENFIEGDPIVAEGTIILHSFKTGDRVTVIDSGYELDHPLANMGAVVEVIADVTNLNIAEVFTDAGVTRWIPTPALASVTQDAALVAAADAVANAEPVP